MTPRELAPRGLPAASRPCRAADGARSREPGRGEGLRGRGFWQGGAPEDESRRPRTAERTRPGPAGEHLGGAASPGCGGEVSLLTRGPPPALWSSVSGASDAHPPPGSSKPRPARGPPRSSRPGASCPRCTATSSTCTAAGNHPERESAAAGNRLGSFSHSVCTAGSAGSAELRCGSHADCNPSGDGLPSSPLSAGASPPPRASGPGFLELRASPLTCQGPTRAGAQAPPCPARPSPRVCCSAFSSKRGQHLHPGCAFGKTVATAFLSGGVSPFSVGPSLIPSLPLPLPSLSLPFSLPPLTNFYGV